MLAYSQASQFHAVAWTFAKAVLSVKINALGKENLAFIVVLDQKPELLQFQ